LKSLFNLIWRALAWHAQDAVIVQREAHGPIPL
jgi:hypothetical protein